MVSVPTKKISRVKLFYAGLELAENIKWHNGAIQISFRGVDTSANPIVPISL